MIFSRVVGTGACLPGAPISNDDLVARGIETSDEWMIGRSGIRFLILCDSCFYRWLLDV